MKIPLVSVIIPMYNAAKFIPQTLESLAYQTMQDFEVVVVDDCSTDTGVEVVEDFANRFGGGVRFMSSSSRKTAAHRVCRSISAFNSLAENILLSSTTTTYLQKPLLRS